LFKKLSEHISRQPWPGYLKAPLIALVYLAALGGGLLLLAVCAAVVLILAPALLHWLRTLLG
jgi:hypothetical protein